jgi:hypothetical protein
MSTSPTPTRAELHANGEAHQIEFTGLHDAGVLGHLAAEEGGPDLAASFGHPGHQLGHQRGVHHAGRDVVEEEQRLGALAHQVVDTHGHQIDADGVEAPDRLGDQGLRADTVRSGHQHRLSIPIGVQCEQSSEIAQATEHLGAEGGGNQRSDPVDRQLTGIDVHTGTGVGGGNSAIR